MNAIIFMENTPDEFVVAKSKRILVPNLIDPRSAQWYLDQNINELVALGIDWISKPAKERVVITQDIQDLCEHNKSWFAGASIFEGGKFKAHVSISDGRHLFLLSSNERILEYSPPSL